VSVESYLRALEHTYTGFEKTSGLCWDDYEYLLFHIPFPKMAYKALERLHRREERRQKGNGNGFTPLDVAFNRRTRPALWANMETGNIYSGSLYLSLAGLMERGDRAVEGARVGLFSYGSGCCAEFFSGRIGPDSAAWRQKIGIAQGLARRVEVDYDRYLRFREIGEQMGREDSYPGDCGDASHGYDISFRGILPGRLRRCLARV
jgi:hydroxymethylglutaryl-CoA synthase